MNFNGNFKGNGPLNICPLCGTHSDIQELCFKCPIILNQVKITEDYENIYKMPISRKLASDLLEITKIRNKAVPARVPVVHHPVHPTDGCCEPCINIVTSA